MTEEKSGVRLLKPENTEPWGSTARDCLGVYGKGSQRGGRGGGEGPFRWCVGGRLALHAKSDYSTLLDWGKVSLKKGRRKKSAMGASNHKWEEKKPESGQKIRT